MRPFPPVRLTAGALAGLTATLLAGCGGGDGGAVAAGAYVSRVCAALGELTGSVESARGELGDALSAPEEGREVLVGFLGEAARAAGEARAAIEAAGVPEVDDGEAAAEAIAAALGDLEAAFAEARGDAEAISIASEEEFAADARELAGTVGDASARIGDSLAVVEDNEELAEAADGAEECDDP